MSCPFFPTKTPAKDPFSNNPQLVSSDPELTIIDPGFPLPYISPYFKLFTKFSQSKRNPLTKVPFHYRNSLFHHNYIKKYRTADFLSKLSVANELRESGNRNYHNGRYDRAALCYEHGFCLFKYAELVDEDDVHIINSENDSADQITKKGIIVRLLINYTLTLIKQKNFAEAEIIVSEAKTFSNISDLQILSALIVLNNSETTFAQLKGFAEIITNYAKTSKNYELKKKFERILYKIQQKNCDFFREFFKEFSSEVLKFSQSNFELEYNVIKKLDEKYVKMIQYYQNSENLAKIIAERRNVQTILFEMNKIKSIHPADSDEIMISHARVVGIDLSLSKNALKFQLAKRSMMSKCFNKGNFNRRVLYSCIQEVMTEFEAFSEHNSKKEYNSLKFNFAVALILLIVVFLSTTSYFS